MQTKKGPPPETKSPRHLLDFSSTATLRCVLFAVERKCRRTGRLQNHTAKSRCATQTCRSAAFQIEVDFKHGPLQTKKEPPPENSKAASPARQPIIPIRRLCHPPILPSVVREVRIAPRRLRTSVQQHLNAHVDIQVLILEFRVSAFFGQTRPND